MYVLQDNVRSTDTDQSPKNKTVAQIHCVNLSLPKLYLIYLPNHHTYTIRLPYSPISAVPFKCSRNGHIEKA